MHTAASGRRPFRTVRGLLSRLGPGLLYAAAAVGVSHLVQATRAGGDYGLALAGVIVVIALVKYPGIRFGADYAAATGRTLIHSYASIGPWVTAIYAAAILTTMAFITAALALVVNGLLKSVLGLAVTDLQAAIVTLALTGALMMSGKYRLLENLNRGLVPLFTVLIVFVTAMLVARTDWAAVNFSFPVIDAVLIMYIVQLAGWMLTPMDGSVAQSLWTCARSKQLGRRLSVVECRLDFNVGYWLSLVLALCFLLMGAGVLYGSGTQVAHSSGAFATQVISLFSGVIGEWSFGLVGAMALLVMYSTLITVLDSFARSLATLADIVFPDRLSKSYEGSIIVIVVFALLVIGAFMESFTNFIDLAGALVFILGPFYAALNHRAMFSPEVAVTDRPGPVIRVWSLLGIGIMSLVALTYVYLRWFA